MTLFLKVPDSSSGSPAGRIRAWPVAVAFVVFATGVPVGLRASQAPTFDLGVFDFTGNLLLYVPLGIALADRRFWVVFPLTILLSVAIEGLQQWFVGRYAGFFDIVANVFGAVIGYWAARGWPPGWRSRPMSAEIGPGSAFLAMLGLVLISAMWRDTSRRSDFSNWDRDFSLLLGNEATGDRPWHGTLAVLAILPSALTSSDARHLSGLSDEELRGAVRAPGRGYVTEKPLIFEGAAARPIPAEVARSLYHDARTSGTLSVVARATTASTRQRGLPRIVSFSRNTNERNFDLGQEGERLWFRIRTPLSGPNGMDWNLYVETSRVLSEARPSTVVAAYDGAVARVFVDGSLVGRTNLAAAGCVLPTACDSDLPIAAALFGAFAAVTIVGVVRPRTPRRARALVLVTGAFAAIWLAIWVDLPGALAVGAVVCMLTGTAVIGASILMPPEVRP